MILQSCIFDVPVARVSFYVQIIKSRSKEELWYFACSREVEVGLFVHSCLDLEWD